jgi:galactonate dehydratase
MSGFVAEFISVRVTPTTVWLFLSLSDGEITGWGEATLNNQEDAVAACFKALPARLSAADLGRLPFDTLPNAAVSSALLQALADLLARRENVPVSQHLGGTLHTQIGLYANINRRTKDRDPQSMAQNAGLALAQGYEAIKIAPFDEVQPTMSFREIAAATELGLARIAAVREMIGDRRLMVDCHWRFDPAGAEALIAAVSPFNLYWIECPIAETEEDIPSLVKLRGFANAAGIRLAGLETAIQRNGFAPYLAAGAYDVMMPDVKYCGGPREMLAIAADLARHGVAFSPHNPTGPICHAHSLHVCAALPQTDLLEHQFDETPMFASLVEGPLEKPINGNVTMPAIEAGLGVSLIAPERGAA